MLKKIAILLDPAPAAAPAGGGAATPPPASTPAPAASPPPSAKPDALPPAGGDDNPFDALDAKITPKARAADAAKEKEKEQPDAKVEPKEPADKPAPDPSRKIESGPKALRDQLEKTNAELKTFRDKANSLESKIAEYEAKGKDTTALAERLANIEKEKETLQAELRGLKQEASPEFKEKYEKPFSRAADVARKIVTQLKVLVPKTRTDPSTGEETTVMEAGRDATWDDFARIFSLPYGQAQEEADKLFGKSERVVMTHYERLHALQEEKNIALADEREQFKQREATDKADRIKNVEAIQSAWKLVNAELLEKNPELYGATPNDAEEAKLVEEAHTLFEANPKTWQQRVVKDAHIRNKLAGFYLARHKLNKAHERIAELEAALAESKGSRPGATQKPGGDNRPAEKTWGQDLRETLAA